MSNIIKFVPKKRVLVVVLSMKSKSFEQKANQYIDKLVNVKPNRRTGSAENKEIQSTKTNMTRQNTDE